MSVRGRVVQVRGDYIKVGFEDEDLKYVGKRGQFLKITTRSGHILVSMVASLELSDELYKQARSLSMFPEAYEDLILRKNDILVTIVGTLSDSGKIQRKYDAVPCPGDVVELMSPDELNKIFHGEGANFIRIGTLVHEPKVGVSLDINQLATKHVAILAMTGAGKSNTLATLVTRMLSKLPSVRIILIDTHSEYINLAKLNKIANNRVTIYCPVGKFKEIMEKEEEIKNAIRSLEIPYWFLNVDEWFSLMGLGYQASTQRRILRSALRNLKGKRLDIPKYFEIEDGSPNLKSEIRSEGSGDRRSMESLLDKLDDITSREEYDFIFYPEECLQFKDDPKRVFKKVIEPLVSPGLKIIALGGIPSEVQTAVVSMLLRTLFRIAVEAKLSGRAIPAIVAVEEAHIYAPGDAYTPSKGIIERIAKEGRKFGIGLVVISQRPKELSSTVLAQCGTLIALRIRNPSDQRYIMESVEDITWYLARSLSGLGVGEALISGFSVPIPCIVHVDAFADAVKDEFNMDLQLGGRDIDVSEEWSAELSERDIDQIVDIIYRAYEFKEEKDEKSKTTKITQFFG